MWKSTLCSLLFLFYCWQKQITDVSHFIPFAFFHPTLPHPRHSPYYYLCMFQTLKEETFEILFFLPQGKTHSPFFSYKISLKKKTLILGEELRVLAFPFFSMLLSPVLQQVGHGAQQQTSIKTRENNFLYLCIFKLLKTHE